MAKYSFIKHLTTIHVKSSLPDPVGDPHLHIPDDDQSGQDIYGEDWTNFEGTFGYGQPVDWCEDNQNLKILLIFKDTKMMFDRFFSVYDSPVHIEYQNPPVSVFIWDPIIVSRIKNYPPNKQITFDRTKKTPCSWRQQRMEVIAPVINT